MKKGYAMVRRLKLTPFELKVAIDALNAKRLKQKANGIDNRAKTTLDNAKAEGYPKKDTWKQSITPKTFILSKSLWICSDRAHPTIKNGNGRCLLSCSSFRQIMNAIQKQNKACYLKQNFCRFFIENFHKSY